MSREFCQDVPDSWGCLKKFVEMKLVLMFRPLPLRIRHPRLASVVTRWEGFFSYQGVSTRGLGTHQGWQVETNENDYFLNHHVRRPAV